jgi:hypothetical protein
MQFEQSSRVLLRLVAKNEQKGLLVGNLLLQRYILRKVSQICAYQEKLLNECS